MRICLVRCPAPFLIDERVFPALGLMAVGTALKQKGHDVTIYDGHIDTIPLDFDNYGFGPTIAEYSFARDAKDKIKAHNPSAKVIIGGPYATLNPGRCMDDNFDCVVRGDGELVAEDAFAGSATLIEADEHPLDDYPTIDRSILDIRSYKYFLDGEPATTLMTSQGCPFKCAFCCKNYTTVRFKSIERVKEEIDDLHYNFKFNALAFPEDLFIMRRKRTESICLHLKSLRIKWRCLVRADMVVKYGPEFTSLMADCGCVDVGMGIESGSDRILKIVNKAEDSSTILKAIELLKGARIRVKGFFIVGLPGETGETITETRRFLDRAKLDDIDIKIYQPYLGSPIWKEREKYDLQWDDNIDFDKLFYKGKYGEYYGNVRTSSLTTEQIYKEWVDIEYTYKRKAA